MKIVTPYRPFVPESGSHINLGPFDWVGAIQMLRASAARVGHPMVQILTDVDTDVPGPVHQYITQERRLMLWLLEVALCYLRSDDFSGDTILISPDALVIRRLTADLVKADLGLMVRVASKYIGKPLLNGVQIWKVSAKDRLVAFYTRVLERARRSDPRLIKWGADTEPIVDLLWPLSSGLYTRHGLSVYGFHAAEYFRTLTTSEADRLQRGFRPPNEPLIVDFKGLRKQYMARYFEVLVPVCV